MLRDVCDFPAHIIEPLQWSVSVSASVHRKKAVPHPVPPPPRGAALFWNQLTHADLLTSHPGDVTEAGGDVRSVDGVARQSYASPHSCRSTIIRPSKDGGSRHRRVTSDYGSLLCGRKTSELLSLKQWSWVGKYNHRRCIRVRITGRWHILQARKEEQLCSPWWLCA